jgi:steroid delta-isomerase-like uncharacterized protein
MPSDPREMSRRIFEEVWNQKKVDIVDELIATNYQHNDATEPTPLTGIAGYKQFIAKYLTAFPDLHFTIHDHIVEGPTVVSRWTATGTHQADLPGIPTTGRPMSVTGTTIARVENGKFVESWNHWDALGFMQQLGVLPKADETSGRAA